jgi:thymidylate synthase (FAD)
MKVRLIAGTLPYGETGFATPVELIGYCAKVSNPSGQDKMDTVEKLMKYLVKNRHWSPFEMVNVVVEIETTRDIARQILRHRSFHFQEFSQRYADPTQMGFQTREPRLQDPVNRQNSIPLPPEDLDGPLRKEWFLQVMNVVDAADTAYRWAIDNGVAKEQARVFLPEGLTTSRMYVNGTLRSWIHYVMLREANGTQLEHQEIAKEVKGLLEQRFLFLKELW